MSKPRGRPFKLNAELVDRVAASIELGMTWARAAEASGVGLSTLHEWRARGEAGEALFVDLVERLKKAEANGIARALESIRSASEGGAWQASAWILERRYPADYGRRSEVSVRASEAQAATATSDAAIVAALRPFAPLLRSAIAQPKGPAPACHAPDGGGRPPGP